MDIAFGQSPDYSFGPWPTKPPVKPKDAPVGTPDPTPIPDDQKITILCRRWIKKQRKNYLSMATGRFERTSGGKFIGRSGDAGDLIEYRLKESIVGWEGVTHNGEAVKFDMEMALEMIQLLNGGLDAEIYGSLENELLAKIDKVNNLEGGPVREEDGEKNS